MEPQLKVSRAITKLVLSHPFFGSMCLSLDVHQDNSIETMCTDGTYIKWNSDFVSECSQDEIIGVLAHEALHVTNKHMLRCGERDGSRWNVACDLAINPILVEAGFSLPDGALIDQTMSNKSAEQIYDALPEGGSKNQGGGFGEVVEASKPDGSELSPAEQSQMEADINAKVMMAAASAKAVGKLPAAIEELVTVMRRVEVDLDTVVGRFVGGDQPDNYTYRRPNKRGLEMYDMYNPSIDAVSVGDTVIVIDESSSVSSRELSYFLGVINSVIEEKCPRSVTVITHDTRVTGVTRYEQGEAINHIACNGRGGTMVGPVFKYIEDKNVPCDQIILLTDMGIPDFPQTAPDYPVLWVSSWKNARPAPFGETTYIKAA